MMETTTAHKSAIGDEEDYDADDDKCDREASREERAQVATTSLTPLRNGFAPEHRFRSHAREVCAVLLSPPSRSELSPSPRSQRHQRPDRPSHSQRSSALWLSGLLVHPLLHTGQPLHPLLLVCSLNPKP